MIKDVYKRQLLIFVTLSSNFLFVIWSNFLSRFLFTSLTIFSQLLFIDFITRSFILLRFVLITFTRSFNLTFCCLISSLISSNLLFCMSNLIFCSLNLLFCSSNFSLTLLLISWISFFWTSNLLLKLLSFSLIDLV